MNEMIYFNGISCMKFIVTNCVKLKLRYDFQSIETQSVPADLQFILGYFRTV